MFRTTPYLKAAKPEIAAFFREHVGADERAAYIRGVFNGDSTELLIGENDERYGYKASPDALHLWAGSFDARTAESFVPWRDVARDFSGLIARGEFLDEPEKPERAAQPPAPAASFSAPPEAKPEAEPAQESLFPSADRQIRQIAAEDASSPAFSMPQTDVNDVLRAGSLYAHGKFRIFEQFQHWQGAKADAAFLKNEYGTGGGSFTFADGSEGSAAYSAKGVFICRHGASAYTAPDRVLTWAQTAEQIRALIDAGQYLTPEEETAYSLWEKGRTAAVAESELLRAQTRPAPRREKPDSGQLTFADLSGGGSVGTKTGTPEPTPERAPAPSVVQNAPETAQAGRPSGLEETEAVVPQTGTPEPQAEKAHADAAEPEETLSDIIPTAADMEEYDALQSERPGELLAFQVGGYCLLFGAQAEIAAPLMGMKIRELDIPGRGVTKVTGFRANEWQVPLRCLWQNGKDVVLLQQEAPGQRRFVNKELKAADFIPLGQKLVIDKRHFVVDAVNWDTGSVSLRDEPFAGATGFPVFRRAPIDYIRREIEAQEHEALRHETPESGFKSITIMLGAQEQEPEQAQPEQIQPEPQRPNFRITDDALGVGGNLFDCIKIFRYVTKGTFDAYNWGLVESKQKFISQVVTGKSPARSCEDVDDTALSYAEVKALATGDERIKEKMELDIEVAKLRVYQTDFNSQHYELEDNVRLHFPRQIRESEAEIAGLEKDISLYREQKPKDPDAFAMTVLDAVFHERKAAGEAIIEACKTVDCTEQAAEIGKYCGFPISIRWDAFSKLFHLSLKNTLSHTVDVGLDASGNVTRVHNALERMPQELQAARNHLDTLHQQMETAKEELQKPFPQEAELVQKEKRLNALNALLSSESLRPHQEQERTGSSPEPALRPAEKLAKPCVHALLSELAKKSEDAPRPERVASLREPVR